MGTAEVGRAKAGLAAAVGDKDRQRSYETGGPRALIPVWCLYPGLM